METAKVWEKPNSLALGFLFMLLVLAQLAEAVDGVATLVISAVGLSALIAFAWFTLGLHKRANRMAKLKQWFEPSRRSTPRARAPAQASATAASSKKSSRRGRVVGPPPSPPNTPTV